MVFAAALALTGTRHKRTRPYRPHTNSKAERYHRTLAQEWAYRRSWASSAEARHRSFQSALRLDAHA